MTNMFANANSLRELTLGPGWQLGAGNPNLRNAPNNTEFTGYWVNVGTGTPANPEASHRFATGAALLSSNVHSSGPHTWVWEPR